MTMVNFFSSKKGDKFDSSYWWESCNTHPFQLPSSSSWGPSPWIQYAFSQKKSGTKDMVITLWQLQSVRINVNCSMWSLSILQNTLTMLGGRVHGESFKICTMAHKPWYQTTDLQWPNPSADCSQAELCHCSSSLLNRSFCAIATQSQHISC